ncbi:Ig-like domain-containing protein, partial [Chitinophagales bacterium]|nr:Ig-like domain-containing protein [Chitinophagales bacterium]
LAAGEDYEDADFGFDFEDILGSIGDYVWHDDNQDGVQDAGEEGIPNVVVTLVNPDGSTETTTTDADGLYLFDDLPEGDYTVVVGSGPEDWFNTTPETHDVSLTEGQDYDEADFGFDVETTNSCDDPYLCPAYEVCTTPITPIVVCPETCAGLAPFTLVDAESLFQCALVELPNGCVQYTPLPGMEIVGTDDIYLTITDALGNCFEQHVIVNIGTCEEPCTADAGDLSPIDAAVCEGESILAFFSESPVVPDGFTVEYLLSSGNNLTILDASDSPSFSALAEGEYTIHTLVSDLNGSSLDGQTTVYQINALLQQGGGEICGAIDLDGVSFDVENCNTDPLALNDSYDCSEGPVFISPLANDTDPDGDELTICGNTDPSGGTLVQDANTFTYYPAAGFVGSDSFSYTVCDGNGGTATAVVSITCVAPPNTDPVAEDDFYPCTDQEVSITVLGNDFDPDGDELTICGNTDPSGGTLVQDANAFTYYPAAGFVGSDSFSYTVCDGNGGTATAVVSITCVAPPNTDPIAEDDFYPCTDQAVSITVLGNDYDPDGDDVTICGGFSQADFGTVVQAGGGFLYTPANGFSGTDSFNYTICDGNGGTDQATVFITCTPPVDCENETITTCVEPVTPIVFCPAFCEFPDGNYEITELSTTYNCSLVDLGDGCIRYTALPGYAGNDVIEVTACNNAGDCATIFITVQVGNCDDNDDPIAIDDSATTDADESVTIPVLSNDADTDGDELSICAGSLNQPAGGTVSIVGDNVLFVPDAGFFGTTTFTYSVCDGNGGSDQATVTLTVNEPIITNDPPNANDDSATTEADESLTIPVLNNDSDPNGDDLSICTGSLSQPAGGTVSIVGNNVLFVPDAGFFGTTTFTYSLCDGEGGSDEATVTVTVKEPIEECELSDQYFCVAPVAEVVVCIDWCLDGAAITDIETLFDCSLQDETADCFNYRPLPGFVGLETITVEGCNGVDCETTTIFVTVSDDCDSQANNEPNAS